MHIWYMRIEGTPRKKTSLFRSFHCCCCVVVFFYSNSVNQGICDLDAKFLCRLNIDSDSNTVSVFCSASFFLHCVNCFYFFLSLSLAQFTKWAFCIENTWKIWMINITFKYLPILRDIFTRIVFFFNRFFFSTLFDSSLVTIFLFNKRLKTSCMRRWSLLYDFGM